MQLTAICAILSIALTGASANPWGGWKPEKPEKPSIKPQANVCGNGVVAYCCNNEAFHGGEAKCEALCKSILGS